VASDSVTSNDLAAFHHDDIYNPVDPDTLADRLVAAGFTDVEVRTNAFGWAARGQRTGVLQHPLLLRQTAANPLRR